MTQLIGPLNPLSYAFFHARGGIKSHLVYFSISAAAVIMLLAVSAQISGDSWRRAMAAWANVLLIVTPSIIGMAGMMSIATAVKADMTSGMTDSLRMMRSSPASVVAGYIFGGITQAFAVGTPLIAAGAFSSIVGGVGAGPYLWATTLLISSIGMFLVASVYLGQSVRFAAMPLVLASILIPVSGPLSTVVPPLALLAGPIAGKGVLELRNVEIEPSLVINLVAQGLVSWVFFVAAMRRFRNPGRIAFRPDLGFAMVLMVSVFGIFALTFWEVVRSRWLNSDQYNLGHIVGTVLPALILGLLPTLSAARIAGDHQRTALEDPVAYAPRVSLADRIPWWLWSFLTAAVGSAPGLMALKLPQIHENTATRWHVMESTIVTFACLLTTFLILSSLTRRVVATPGWVRFGGVLVGLAGFLLLMAAPVVQWFMLMANDFRGNWAETTHLIQFSPIGAICMSWSFNDKDFNRLEPIMGAATFGLLALIMLFACRLPPASSHSKPVE